MTPADSTDALTGDPFFGEGGSDAGDAIPRLRQSTFAVGNALSVWTTNARTPLIMGQTVKASPHPRYDAVVAAWGWLFGWPVCRQLNNLLLNLSTRGLGVGNWHASRNGECRALAAWLKQRGPAPVVWDVGANCGEYTGMVVAARPDARIWAFEPNRATHARLVARVGGHPGVRCVNCALGREAGELELWDFENAPEGSELATFYPDTIRRFSGDAKLIARSVPVRTIDELAREEGVGSIDLLKIDVEGHELACLEGAAGLLAAGRIAAVQFEFNVTHLESRTNMWDFAERLPGFALHRILPHGLLPLNLHNNLASNLYNVQNIFAIAPSRASGQTSHP